MKRRSLLLSSPVLRLLSASRSRASAARRRAKLAGDGNRPWRASGTSAEQRFDFLDYLGVTQWLEENAAVARRFPLYGSLNIARRKKHLQPGADKSGPVREPHAVDSGHDDFGEEQIHLIPFDTVKPVDTFP